MNPTLGKTSSFVQLHSSCCFLSTCVAVRLITPQLYIIKWKATKVHVHTHHYSILFQHESAYWSLKPQLETVIIEVSTVQTLRLRANLRRLHRVKQLRSAYLTYGDTGFNSCQTSYLSIKVLTFAIDEDMFKPLLTWAEYCWHFSHRTNFITTCNSVVLTKAW